MPKAKTTSDRKLKRIMQAEERRAAKQQNGGKGARELRRQNDPNLGAKRDAALMAEAACAERERDLENKSRRAREAEERLAAARLATQRMKVDA